MREAGSTSETSVNFLPDYQEDSNLQQSNLPIDVCRGDLYSQHIQRKQRIAEQNKTIPFFNILSSYDDD
jgi:hypothetical protein